MKKWTNTNPMRRLLSLALSMAMVLTLLPMPSIAAEGDGLCEHHPEHTGCGYVAAVEGHDCGHVCGEECYTVTTDCQHVHDESCYSDGVLPAEGEEKAADACAHTACTEESGCVTKAHTCTHKHDGSCGYVEAVEGSPCTYQCEICAGARVESQPEKTVISAWEWDDGYEIVDEKSGYVVLPFTSEDFTSQLDDVKGMLPEAILVGEEALTLGNWTYETGEEGAIVTIDSESCPSPGIFKTTLPEGYVLADGTNVLSLTVALSAGSSEGTSSYADSGTLTNVSYYDAKGMPQTCQSATKVTADTDVEGGDTITWTSGWYAVEAGNTVKIGDYDQSVYRTVKVQGDVHLIMTKGSHLFLSGQIEVLQGNSLTVYCDNASNSGELQVWSTQLGHASIGGSTEHPDSGNITINGGYVHISSQRYNTCAGIGSGEGGSAGDITINGGKFDLSWSGNSGAAIGTGKNGKSATITINNCYKINAHSSSGAGIGSGEASSDEGKVTVNINGGTGITSKSASGAGIGSGENAPLSVDVNINGGDIYAQTIGLSNPASHGAAIGGGYGATNTTVNIGGSAEVDAHGGENAPGIGSINPDGCSVTISGGTVKAKGGTRAAGIGGAPDNNTSCPITIRGGTVTATGGNLGAGIGSGSGNDSKTTPYSTGTIIISGGTVTAEGSYWAAGIGGGAYCTAGQIQIDGGTVIANRDASNDGGIFRAAFDIGDGATGSNMKKTYARYTLNGSAKLYLQNGFSNPGIRDEIKPTINSGYVFNGTTDTYSEIQVYGSQTLNEEFCIETGKKMTVTNGASLTASSRNLYVEGTLAKEGTGSASGNIYYPLTLTDCTASGNTSTYGENNKLFGKAGALISLTPDLPAGYKFDGWTVNNGPISGNSFTMPAQATTVKANLIQTVKITGQPESKTITYLDNVTLSVIAENSSGTAEGITYQWYKDGTVLEGETASTLTLTRPQAGTYTYYCAVSCDGVTVNSNEATVMVNKAAGSVTINNDPSKTYDGQSAVTGYTVTGSGNVTIKYKVKDADDSTYTEFAPTDAGNYTVRVTLPESKNYFEASDTKDFTISKATDNKWKARPTVTDFTYGDTVTSPVTCDAQYGNGNVVVTYKKQGTEDNPSTDVPKDAGTYDVTVSLAETASYPGLDDVKLTLTISKAASSVTAEPTDAQSLYTGNPVSLVTAGTAVGGTMHYSLDGENWSKNIPTATDWKTYTVYYKVVGDQNHNDSAIASLTAEIVPFRIPSQPQPDGQNIDYGEDATLSVGLDTKVTEGISYQWCLVTVEGGKEIFTPMEGETGKKLTLTKPNAGKYVCACIITCGDYSETSGKATVTVKEVPQNLPTTDLPDGLWVEGGEKPLVGNSIDLKSPSSFLMTSYSYNAANTDVHQNYPTGMQVYSVQKDDLGQTVVAPVAELGNLLRYSGCSIRITGKPGIRMITSLTKEAKELLKQGKLADYTLEEYGTVVAWKNTLGDQPLTLSTGNSNYAYRKGVSDPVFANVGALTQYTNVLVWNELDDAKYAEDIVMRPYIILSKDGETVTLYGGTVSRSIGYVAQQNANTFPVGSAGYNYVHDIIDKVTNLPGGNGE